MPQYTCNYTVAFKMADLKKKYRVLIPAKEFLKECRNELMQYAEGILAAGYEQVYVTALDHIIIWALREKYIEEK